MYSATTFRTKSGRMRGVNKKLDRVARRHVSKIVPDGMTFPTAHEILHFEGLHGPDGIKRKSPAVDEPWHYVDPNNPDDREIVVMINEHIQNLANALRENNTVRAAFEAAWMAHAIVDGLTPAHHYPLEAKLEELRNGEGLETRTTTKAKILLPGQTRRIQLRNNWEFWGAKGVMTTHLAFELGVATNIAPLRFEGCAPTEDDMARIKKDGYEPLFLEILGSIADMKMYEEFGRLGWTRHLANETKNTLIPEIVRAVMMGWYQAMVLAEKK